MTRNFVTGSQGIMVVNEPIPRAQPEGEVCLRSMYDVSHIILLPCGKEIWLISPSSYLGYKEN